MATSYANVLSVLNGITVEDLVANLPGKQFVHIDHSAISMTDNLIQISRKAAPEARAKLVELVNRGFSLYRLKDGVSSFVAHERIKDVWGSVKDGTFKTESGLVYSVTPPGSGTTKKLLVIFSSISSKMYQSGLARHFEQNFASAVKHIPPNTAILRIADLGGVCGAFYMDTNFLRTNEIQLSALLEKVINELHIASSDVVMFGTSKGATAALFYGVKHDSHFISVDPIVSDEHYIKTYRDAHFTVGVFPFTKQDKFRSLLEGAPAESQRNRILVYSSRSPQFTYINDIVRCSASGVAFRFVNCNDVLIKNHPDVASVTRDIWQALLNLSICGLPYIKKSVEIIR